MIRFPCERCGKTLGVRDERAGKAVRCPGHPDRRPGYGVGPRPRTSFMV